VQKAEILIIYARNHAAIETKYWYQPNLLHDISGDLQLYPVQFYQVQLYYHTSQVWIY